MSADLAPSDARAAHEFDPRDEDGRLRADYVGAVEVAIEAGDAATLKRLTVDQHEADLGDLLEALDAEQRAELIRLLGADFDFTALIEVDDTIREQILEDLSPQEVADGVRDLESDDAVYILEDLDEADQKAVLDQIPVAERIQLKRALDYGEDSAGRLMRSEFIAVAPFWTVGQAIDYCRETQDLPESFTEIYVIDEAFRLVGIVPLDRLLRAKRPTKIIDLAETDPHFIEADEEQEEVARTFERYNLIAAPVVDDKRHLVGVITIDDVVDVVKEVAEDDYRALAGVGDEEVSDSVLYVARSRFSWLFINLLTAILASVVIGFFEASLTQMVALAVLMPIVASQGGNAGTQTMAVAVRGLATQELTTANMGRIILREVWVGLINGLAFAVIMGVVAGLWFQDWNLGFVIGLAIVATLVAAAMGGVLIPLALDRLGYDPAVASGPFVTTVTDIVGFFSFLGVATLWFGLK